MNPAPRSDRDSPDITPPEPTHPGRIGHAVSLLRLAMPIAAAQIAQMAMGLTDSILLGGLGHAALAAGGLAVGMFFTLVVTLQGILSAASVGISQAMGAKASESWFNEAGSNEAGAGRPEPGRSGRANRVGRITASALLLGLAMSPPVFAVFSHAEWILLRLDEPGPLAHDVGAYLRVLRWAAPPALVGFGLLRAVLPAIGAAGLLLRIMPVMAVLNGCLNYGLIYGHWGLPRLGFLGSALATTLTIWTSPCVLAAAMLSLPARRGLLHPFVPDLAALRMLLRLGVPICLTIAAELMLFQAVSLQAGMLGSTALAAHQIALNVASIVFMVPMALSQAANVRVGHWTGAGQPREARRSGLVAIGLTLLVMSALGLILLALPLRIASIYLDSASPANRDALRVAASLLGIAALFQIADGVQSVSLGALRGIGDTAVPMLIATAGYWLIGFPLGTVAAFRLGLGVRGLWLGIAAALASVAVMTSLRFLRQTRLATHLTAPGPVAGIA